MTEQGKYSAAWVYGHFLLGVVCTWLVFELVVEEVRGSRWVSKMENMDIEATLYREKAAFLEDQLQSVRLENDRLLQWLTSKPKSIPYYELELKKLKTANTQLERKVVLFQKKTTPEGWKALGEPVKARQKIYNHVQRIPVGETFADDVSGIRLSLTEVARDFTAELDLAMPGQRSRPVFGVKAGANWTISNHDRRFRLKVRKVDWLNHSVEIEIQQISG